MRLPPPFDKLDGFSTSERGLTSGELLFRQGDSTRGLFALASGRVELRRVTRSGNMVVIHNVRQGEIFAEASLFSSTYHCDAIALDKCRLIEFDKRAILSRFTEQPDFALAMTQRFAIQIQSYRRKIEIIAIRNAQERVFAAVSEGLLQSDIKSFASEIGLTHETVYRALANLVLNGRLTKSGRGIYHF